MANNASENFLEPLESEGDELEVSGEPELGLFIPGTREIQGYREVSRRRTLYLLIGLTAMVDIALVFLYMFGPSLSSEQLVILGSVVTAANSAVLVAVRWLFRH